MREFIFGLLCAISFPAFAGKFDYDGLKFAVLREYNNLENTKLQTSPKFWNGEKPWWSGLCSDGVSVVGTLGSYHAGFSGRARPNEVNIGGGVRCHVNEYMRAEAIVVPRNSMRGLTATVGGGPSWTLFEIDEIKFSGGFTLQTGLYENTRIGKFVPVIFGGPTIEVEYKKTSLWGLLIPAHNPVVVGGWAKKF